MPKFLQPNPNRVKCTFMGPFSEKVAMNLDHVDMD